jgi:hypothetical protein
VTVGEKFARLPWYEVTPVMILAFQEGTLSTEQHHPFPRELHISILDWEYANYSGAIVHETLSSGMSPLDRPNRPNYTNIPQNNYPLVCNRLPQR